MNEDILKGKWKKLKGEAKIWWGHKTGDPLSTLEGNKDKIAGWLQEKKGLTKEEAEKEWKKLTDAKEAMESRSEEVTNKIKSKFDKFTHDDIAEIDGNFETWADKIKEKYHKTQEEANKQIKDFMTQFEKK